MHEPDKKWDIYYCGNNAEEPAAASEPPTDAADIPISKTPVQTPAEPEEPYSNDYASDFGEDGAYANAFSRFWLRNNRRNIKLLIVFLLVLLILAGTGLTLFITQKLNMIDYNPGVNFEHADQTDVIEEDPVFTPMHDVTDASSLRDWMQKWALNGGDKMHTKNVVNCLLCGVDTQEETAGRTDAMILISVNKRTGKISLVSFMRDSYTYMNINGSDRWYKINSAYNWGGAATLVETIENNYKIEIDNYVTVDFDTFPQLINAIGGIEVEVEEYEARFIRRTSSHKKFPYSENGEKVRLNGDQALIYSRIRYSDSDGDVSRTRRQRKLIGALIEKTHVASIGQLNNMLNTVLPYVETNYRRSQILSLGTQAIMQKWMDFDIEQISCPLLLDSEDGTQSLTGKDSYMMTGYGYRQEFVWVVDYQMDAQRVQKALYGTTNVILDEDRVSPFAFLSGSGYVPSTTSSYSYTPTTTSAYNDGANEDADTTSTTRFVERFTNLTNMFEIPKKDEPEQEAPAEETPQEPAVPDDSPFVSDDTD